MNIIEENTSPLLGSALGSIQHVCCSEYIKALLLLLHSLKLKLISQRRHIGTSVLANKLERRAFSAIRFSELITGSSCPLHGPIGMAHVCGFYPNTSLINGNATLDLM